MFTENLVDTFGRQALPMVWDFAEANPFGSASGDISSQLGWHLDGLKGTIAAVKDSSGHVEISSATRHPLPNDLAQGFFTDPPYYDAIAYGDLSDFFYVWLKRTLGDLYPTLLSGELSDKCEEIVYLSKRFKGPYSHKTKDYFEKNMQIALEEGNRIVNPNGLSIVVFAHKSTEGWEAMLKAIIDAGWVVTGSWPIDTEMNTRMNAMGTATLASSIHLVCRTRKHSKDSLRTDNIGDWRTVLSELPKRIHEWMPRLSKEGIVGADAIFACLGPALEIYSRYSSVEKASGEKVTLKEYLQEVWAAVSHEALNMIFEGADASGFEEDARLTAMWLWTLRTTINGHNKDDEDVESPKSLPGYSLEYDAARKIAQGLGVHLENLSYLVEIKGNTAVLLSAAARTRYLFGKDAAQPHRVKQKKKPKQLALFNPVDEMKQIEEESGEDLSGKFVAKPGSTVLDQLHQSMILFGTGRSEALKRFLVEEGVGRNQLFWRLAQALSALYPAGTDEKRWVDGVMARKKGLGLN